MNMGMKNSAMTMNNIEQIQNKLTELIKDLPPIDKGVLMLYYNENLNYEQISSLMGLTIDTVSMKHQNALTIFNNYLKSKMPHN